MGYGLVVFLTCPIAMFFQRGDWKFDTEGIRWKPLGRKERYLMWIDVDRVHLMKRTRCRLRSKSTEMVIHWHNWPKKERLRAVEMIEKTLAPFFPFDEHRETIWRSWALAYLRLLVISIVVLFAYNLLERPVSETGGPFTGIVLFFLIFGPYSGYAYWECKREEKKCWVWRRTPQK